MTYEAGQVVRVPFPFTRPCRQQEPARVGTVGCRRVQHPLGSSGAGHDHLGQERALAAGLYHRRPRNRRSASTLGGALQVVYTRCPARPGCSRSTAEADAARVTQTRNRLFAISP